MSKIALRVTAAQCPRCLDIIFSRNTHDFRTCTCGDTSIDGGRGYTKLAFKTVVPHTFDLYCVGLTAKDLARDYTLSEDKFGLIKTNKIAYGMLYRYTLNARGKFYRYEKKK